jgi:tRNA A37 threonylcarbamoyladenosine modification protein TsaB
LNLEDGITFVGDGALRYTAAIAGAMPRALIQPDVPPLAPAIAALAEASAARDGALPPDAIRPIYVRRSDAELARDRRASEPSTQHQAPGTSSKP